MWAPLLKPVECLPPARNKAWRRGICGSEGWSGFAMGGLTAKPTEKGIGIYTDNPSVMSGVADFLF